MATSIGNDTPKSPVSSTDRSPAIGSRNLDDDKEMGNGEIQHGYSFNASKAEENYPGSSAPGSPTGLNIHCLRSQLSQNFISHSTQSIDDQQCPLRPSAMHFIILQLNVTALLQSITCSPPNCKLEAYRHSVKA